MNQLICHGLLENGFAAEGVSSGEDALLEYDNHRPDAILLDVLLPGISGFQVCDAIRHERGDTAIPIIMLTGSDDVASISEAFETGATDFLTKPINIPLLRERVRYALRSSDNERSLHQALDFQDRANDLVQLGYWAFYPDQNTFEFNRHARRLLELPKSDPSKDNILEMIHADDRSRVADVLAQTRAAELEFRITLPSAGERIMHASAAVYDPEKGIMNGAFQDITDQRSTEDMLAYLRLYDDMTGLLNDRMLRRHLGSVGAADTSGDRVSTLSVIGVSDYGRKVEVFNQFRVNMLVKQMADELKSFVSQAGENTRAYYVGNGRFAITHAAHTRATINAELTTLMSSLDKERLIDRELLRSGPFCGAIELQAESAQPDVQYQRALLALDYARAGPDNGIYWLGSSETERLRKEMTIERAVQQGIENDEFELYLQPQVGLSEFGTVWGFESLIRWPAATGHELHYSPAEFLPAVERLGLMINLGHQVIRKAFRAAAFLRAEGLGVRIGINLAAQQFGDEQLVPRILDALSASGVSPDAIEFEITEGTAMADPENTLQKLNDLRGAGFHLAIDDFGIGYSSMEYLLRFPLTTLKIDRAFVKEVTVNRESRAIVMAIVTLAKGLGLTTIAEGVESERQRDYLDALGVDVIQGYFYSPALPLKRAVEFGRQWNRETS